MLSLRIHVAQIIDYGDLVCIVGVDLTATKPVAVIFDYRPLQAILETLRSDGFVTASTYAPVDLTLKLAKEPEYDGDGGGEQLPLSLSAA